jgi:hypothetical protein
MTRRWYDFRAQARRLARAAELSIAQPVMELNARSKRSERATPTAPWPWPRRRGRHGLGRSPTNQQRPGSSTWTLTP